MTTLPFDLDTGVLVVPLRVPPNWFAALATGVECTGVQLGRSDQGDGYVLTLHGLKQEAKVAPSPPDEAPDGLMQSEKAKPNRATRRRKTP